ncbi:hypothetical protein D3C74_376610 [compost metagenome]
MHGITPVFLRCCSRSLKLPCSRIIDLRLHIEHFVDPQCGSGSSGNQHEHHGYHNQGEHNLHRILNKSHQRADLQIAIADPDAAEIQNGNHRKVHNKHH